MANQKSNNADASEKVNPSHEDGLASGAHGTKDNSECATLRLGALPQAEKVRELPLEGEKGVAASHAATQNQSDGKGKAGLNVPPSGRDFPTVVSPD
jgi:hypothetical protein